MDNDSKALKGRGALLFVTKWEPKTWVSCLDESMEFVFKPLNHLIATGPKLDGKTLHISTSFFRMDSHPLIKLAHMLHGVCFAVVNGEGWPLESSRKYSPFYVVCER